MAKFNYRQYYKDYYRLEFNKDFDIHHIDQNRENNSIYNLILLPRKIHHQYHNKIQSYYFLTDVCGGDSFMFNELYADGCKEALLNLLEISRKIVPWVNYKAYLDRMMMFRMDSWEKIIIEHTENGCKTTRIPEPKSKYLMDMWSYRDTEEYKSKKHVID